MGTLGIVVLRQLVITASVIIALKITDIIFKQ